nr:PAS domain S-box protein [Methylobacterium sp. L1A1]
MTRANTQWPDSDGELAALIRTYDWAATPLGLIEGWSDRLKVMVEQVLASPLVATLVCGPDKILIYNDAARLYGYRHPAALGRPLPETFRDGWSTVAPFYAHAFAGETVRVEAQPLDTRGEGKASDVFDALLTPVRESDGGIAYVHMTGSEVRERVHAEAALRASEERYRSLFQRMGQGYCELELIRDGDGRAVDQRYIAFNPAFERLFGIQVSQVVGQTASAVFPGLEPWWHETFDRIVRQGKPERIEHAFAALNRWFEVHVYPAENDRLTVLYEDVTQRRRADDALRESEERQAFLLKLSDAIRPLSDATEIQATTTQLVGEHLSVDRAMYGEVTGKPGEETGVIRGQFIRPAAPDRPAPAPFPDRFTFETFGSDAMARRYSGEGLAVADVNADPGFDATEREAWARVGVQAAIVAPLVKGNRLVAELGVHSETSRTWTDAEISLVREVGERTWAAAERVRAEAARRESEERFRQFAHAAAEGAWIRNAETLDMEYVSPVASRIYGVEPQALFGGVQHWAGLVLPEDRDVALARLEEARRGRVVVHEFRIQRPSDGAFRWIRSTDFPLFDGQGGVQRVGGLAEDVTEAKLAIEHQGVLLAELQHRVRNIMALLRSITSRTGDRAESVLEYRDLMMGRLLAFARVQALLTRTAKDSVGIASLVHDEVSVYAQHEGQFGIDGPNIALSPKAAEVLTLAIHELATDAVKYGALSMPTGKVTVRWLTFEKRGGSWLALDWTEEGAPIHPQPTPDVPRRRDFGSELIEARIPYELRGCGQITIEPGGARCHLEFPLQEGASVLETGAPQLASVFGGAIDMTGEPDLTGRYVLVVEDDYYLATDTARALRSAGADVTSLCATEADARAELEDKLPNAAIVDINLGPGPSFKLAERLKDRGVPFVFITGYNAEVIPVEFEQVERLEKPLQLRQLVGAIARLTSPIN